MALLVRVAVLLAVTLTLTGCMSNFRARCTAYGFPEGTPEHAACTQRAVERWEDGLRQWSQTPSHIQAVPQPQRPVTCLGSGFNSVTCY
jgi:hypothetical protein